MSEPISVFIWQWYDEKDKVNAVFSLGDSLTELALSPEDKASTIPDCPFCELVNKYLSAEEKILKLDVQVFWIWMLEPTFLVSVSKPTKSQNPHSVVMGKFSQEKLEHRVKNCCPGLGTELLASINKLSELIENLPSQETQCFSREIFWLPTWREIGNNAGRALELLDWEALSEYRSELQN